jgi:hypothetical protein
MENAFGSRGESLSRATLDEMETEWQQVKKASP